jgi:hypothetical protein
MKIMIHDVCVCVCLDTLKAKVEADLSRNIPDTTNSTAVLQLPITAENSV